MRSTYPKFPQFSRVGLRRSDRKKLRKADERAKRRNEENWIKADNEREELEAKKYPPKI